MADDLLVLIVSDIPDHIESYETALRARGMTVVAIETGGETFTTLQELRPHCIIIDERLSDMRGWELCQEIKRDPRLPPVPIIMLAQELTLAAAARGRQVGCDAWLTRASVADDLVRTIHDVLGRGETAPRSSQEALVGFATCAACGSARIRAGVRVGPAQYFTCGECGLRWRTEAKGEATA